MGSRKLFWIFPLRLSLIANEGKLTPAGRLVSSSLESTFIILRAILRDVLMVFGIGFGFLFNGVYNPVFGQFKGVLIFKRRTRRCGTNITYNSSIWYDYTCRHNSDIAVFIIGKLKDMDIDCIGNLKHRKLLFQ